MNLMERIAEQRIAEAAERGELAGLEGEGRPQDLDDLAGVPRELRPAYLMLRNAGFVPPDLHTRRLISDVEQLLAECGPDDGVERRQLSARLAVLQARLERERGRRLGGAVSLEFRGPLEKRFG